MPLADLQLAGPRIASAAGEKTARKLSQMLLDVTKEQLWNPKRWWINDRNPNAVFIGRTRPGRKTYHFATGPNHEFTVGIEMIADILSSEQAAGRWLPATEITDRGYFGGVLSIEAVLTSVMCHEFAHCIQYLSGRRLPKHVHDEGFYAILDRIHASGASRTFLMSLKLAATDDGLELAYFSS